MPAGWISNPEGIKSIFYLGQVFLGSLLVASLLWSRKRPSGFKLREADRLKGQVFPRFPGPVVEPSRRSRRPVGKEPPLLLSGISIHGPAHQVLGVRASASAAEVRKAWKDLMKRYHPDKVGRPGTREWTDAQRIAEAINRAKEEMSQRRKKA